VGELEDAIREHLELKRQRGADPAEVAREEHEALAPVTRSHPVVLAPPGDAAEPDAREADHADPGPAGASEPETAALSDEAEVDHDATQEFRVEHDGDWLAPDDGD
jgi:hypothetical protein